MRRTVATMVDDLRLSEPGFPTAQSKEIVRALIANDRDVSFVDIDSPHGHDAFLIDIERLARITAAFLDGSQRSQPIAGRTSKR